MDIDSKNIRWLLGKAARYMIRACQSRRRQVFSSPFIIWRLKVILKKNPFTILNDTPVHYLEKVASSCDIALGSQSESVKEVILAMQAQELVRAAIAKVEGEVCSKSSQKGVVEKSQEDKGVDVDLDVFYWE